MAKVEEGEEYRNLSSGWIRKFEIERGLIWSF